MSEPENIKKLLDKKNIILSLIVAQTKEGLIGLGDEIPWHIPEDLRFFKETTMNAQLIMGRRTFENIVSRLGRPLPGRRTIVLSRSRAKNPSSKQELVEQEPGFTKPFGESPQESLSFARDVLSAMEALEEGRPAFVAGGAQVYAAFEPWVSKAWITLVTPETPDLTKPLEDAKKAPAQDALVFYDALLRLKECGLQIQQEKILSKEARTLFLEKPN